MIPNYARYSRDSKRRKHVEHVSPESKSVLIISDRIFEAMGLAALLTEAGGFTVLEPTTDVTTAEQMAAAHQPDIAVVLNRSNARSVVRALKSSAQPTLSIVVAAEPNGNDNSAESAKGLLLVPPDPDVLIPALRMTAAGYRVFRVEEGGTNAESMNRTLHSVGDRLTWREFEVFSLAARGCTNAEIGSMLGISERTVKGHVSRIMEKLKLSGRTDLIIKAYASSTAAADR